MIAALLQVALGGALGSVCRYLVNLGAARAFGTGFPWATLVVNVAGSVAMGVLVVALAQKAGIRPFLMTGLLGGFTTFSAFSLDALTLFERGQAGMAAAYVLGSVVLSLAGIAAGVALARMVLT